ncbi:MAG TPA: hypothetical protein VLB10_01705 [Gammaproteobacteria bacterium]|nr:hypothetical protein [Gammaproteobacteria bacterium]
MEKTLINDWLVDIARVRMMAGTGPAGTHHTRLPGSTGDSPPAERFSCAKRDSFLPKGLHQVLLPFVVEVRLLADDRCGGTAVQRRQAGKQAGNAI